MKLNKKEDANLYLIRILLLAKYLNHKVCITVPPVRSDYKIATGMKFNMLFKSLLEILNNFHINFHVDLINAYDNDFFIDDYFGDYDHLLPLGKGTEFLSDLIYKNFKRN